LLLCLLFAAANASQAQAPATGAAASATPEQDIIHLKDGKQVFGNIVRRTGDDLDLQTKTSFGAIVSQRIPIAKVEQVDFSGAEKAPDEIAQATDASTVLEKWRAREDLLAVPESFAGAYGIRTAQLMLEGSSKDAIASAGAILQEIIEKDWSALRRDRARALAIEALRRAGKHDEMLRTARDFLSGDAAFESKAEVSYYLALALIDDYHTFLAENPRWEIDPYARPQRQRLYNDVLDCLLAPYLRYGAPSEFTAKSLLAAVTFLNEAGDHSAARGLAEDLTILFPDTPQAAPAQKFLDEN